DVVVDHRLAANFESVMIGPAEQVAKLQSLIRLYRLSWRAGSDAAQHGHARARRPMIHQHDCPCRKAFTLDQSLLFQGFEVTHDAIWRADVETQPDLPNRGPVAPTFDLLADELVDFPLAFGQLAEIGHRLLLNWGLD